MGDRFLLVFVVISVLVLPSLVFHDSTYEASVLVWVARAGFPVIVTLVVFALVESFVVRIAKSRGKESGPQLVMDQGTPKLVRAAISAAYFVACVIVIISVYGSVVGIA